MVRMAYPPAAAPEVETVPMPPPPQAVGPAPIVFAQGAQAFVDARRIAGTKLIVPSDDVKTALSRAHITRLKGTFRVCLDPTGHVAQVLPARSTGFAAYDREILEKMRAWVYTPMLIDGAPVAICTSVTFIYNQR
jgi:hypothetical protein